MDNLTTVQTKEYTRALSDMRENVLKIARDTVTKELSLESKEEYSTGILKSKDIALQENEEKCTDNPGSKLITGQNEDGNQTSETRANDGILQPTGGESPFTPGTFYDIGFGIQLYSTSDVSNNFRAIRWKSDDYQSSFSDDKTFKNYKLETDVYCIEATDPKDKENFPKDSFGMITLRVKLPNDINYQFLQLKAYIKFGVNWTLVDASLEDKSVLIHTIGLNVLCIVSKPIKESLNISPAGCEYVAQTDERIKISIPPGAVENDETICIHVIPVNKEILRRKYEESNKTGEAMLAMSDCLYSSGDKALKKKVKVKLPLNDIRKPNESDKEYEYRLYRQTTNGQFSLTDNLVMVDDNHIAVFETNKISGTSVSLIGKEELKKDSLVISGNIEEMHGLKAICKILFFVNDVTLRGLTVLLACIEKSKMEDFCNRCEERGFQLFKNWISKDFPFKPQTKLNITLRGFFSLPRFTTRKKLDLTFLPNSAENFTRFKVEIKPKMDQDAYGLLVLTKNEIFVDEICYNPVNNGPGTKVKGRYSQKQTMKGPNSKTNTTGKSRLNSEEDFLTEKGVMTVATLLNAEKLFETVLHMDMKKDQYDQICDKRPPGIRQAFEILKTALNQQKHKKIDSLTNALETAGEGGLAHRIRQFYKEGLDLSLIKK